MRIWDGGCFPHAGSRLHGASAAERSTVTSGVATMEYLSCQMSPAIGQLANHSVEFVDSVTGVHTQNIESDWNRVKMKLKRMKGCRAEEIPGYLDEFM